MSSDGPLERAIRLTLFHSMQPILVSRFLADLRQADEPDHLTETARVSQFALVRFVTPAVSTNCDVIRNHPVLSTQYNATGDSHAMGNLAVLQC